MPRNKDKNTESEEMYLKTIYQVMKEKGASRSKDISKAMGVSSSSVTGALRHLKDRGLINYEPYDVITLTEDGQKIALDILNRYDKLCDFFINILKLDETEAQDCACRLEHVISSPVLTRIADFAEFIRDKGENSDRLLDQFVDSLNKQAS